MSQWIGLSNNEPRADFWDMQRHTLQRLLTKIDEAEEASGGSRRRGRRGRGGRDDVKGLVVRLHRPENDISDLGI